MSVWGLAFSQRCTAVFRRLAKQAQEKIRSDSQNQRRPPRQPSLGAGEFKPLSLPDAATQPQTAFLSAGPTHVPLGHTCRPLSHSRTFQQLLATQHGPRWAKVKTPSPSCWLELSRVSNKVNTHVPKLMKPDMALHSPMQRQTIRAATPQPQLGMSVEGKRHCSDGLQESRSRHVGSSLSPPSSPTPLLSALICPLRASRCSLSIPRSFLLRGLATTAPLYRSDPQDVLMPGSFSPPGLVKNVPIP